jgi:hypothetical protein
MSKLALTLKPSTRRCTQLIGISRSIAEASAGRSNSIVAETRAVVVNGWRVRI